MTFRSIESPEKTTGLFLYIMQNLIDKLKRFREIVEPSFLFVEVMKNERLKELIIKLNTGGPNNALPTSQLWHGIDSKGKRLEDTGGGHPVTGTYSPLTIEATKNTNGFSGKRERGLPFDRITLYNDGIFYDSWRVGTEVRGRNVTITIDADPNRGGSNLFDDWGEDIVGLTEENTDIFTKEFVTNALDFIRSELRKL